MVPVFDRRKLRPLILALAIALCAFQLTTCTGMWLLDPLIVRATHVGLVLSMLFLWRSSNRALRKNPRPEPAWSFLFDILMIAMSAGAAAYIITNFSYIQDRMPHIDELTAWDLFWGAGLIIAILEATRRVAGLALVIVSGIALLYAFFGHLLPGNMGHLYLAPNQIIESLYLLNDGIWGSSIGASATIIYVFILFGALLEKTNMASVFLELACLVTRNAKGGPAKAAIFGSALFGSVSGSAGVGTGSAVFRCCPAGNSVWRGCPLPLGGWHVPAGAGQERLRQNAAPDAAGNTGTGADFSGRFVCGDLSQRRRSSLFHTILSGR